MNSYFVGHRFLNKAIMLLSAIAFILILIYPIVYRVSLQQTIALISFSGLTVIFLLVQKKSFRVMFLLSTFTLITAWRLCALTDYTFLVYLYFAVFMMKILNYGYCAYTSIKRAKDDSPIMYRVMAFEWQLVFVRMFIGYDLIPHFCEKLFAGTAIRTDDVQAFSQLGVHAPLTMVLLAGVIELAGAFAISCGFLTRLGSLCLSIYLLFATYLGDHFAVGFIWAMPGGGWEYPVLWAALILSFGFFGAGDFSLDKALKDRFSLPLWLKHSMGGRFV